MTPIHSICEAFEAFTSVCDGVRRCYVSERLIISSLLDESSRSDHTVSIETRNSCLNFESYWDREIWHRAPLGGLGLAPNTHTGFVRLTDKDVCLCTTVPSSQKHSVTHLCHYEWRSELVHSFRFRFALFTLNLNINLKNRRTQPTTRRPRSFSDLTKSTI